MLGASQKFSKSSKGAQPDPEQLKRLLSGPEGQALLRLLQADGGAGLRAAAAALQNGNPDGVREALTPLLAGTDAAELTRRMEEAL